MQVDTSPTLELATLCSALLYGQNYMNPVCCKTFACVSLSKLRWGAPGQLELQTHMSMFRSATLAAELNALLKFKKHLFSIL